mgnify:FL=1
MIPIHQRIIDPEKGDCYRAAIASILELELDEVPEDIASGFSMESFLQQRGLCAIHLPTYRLAPHDCPDKLSEPWDARRFARYDWALGAIALASVPSQRFPGGWHAIVVGFVPHHEHDRAVEIRCLHDPNPKNDPYDIDKTEIRSLTFFMPAGVTP